MDILEIKISLDGDKWCALVGENLQEGVAGFGDTPTAAIRALCDKFALNPWYLQNITLW